ncbi:MAG: response regulator [Luteitalea sp.]|nr:response regulator [Luteitalea sp.]
MVIHHPLLKRQLKRLLGGSAGVPREWEALVAVVDQTYQEAESDRRMLERSLELSSQELMQANAQMRAARDDLEQRVQDRTGDLLHVNQALREQIAERRRIEDQLRHSQKMEAVGCLAGGVAHDFNNLLTVITGFGDLLQTQFEPATPQWANLEEIRRAAERATSLTRQLLAFSRRQVLQPRVLALNDTIEHMRQMLDPLISEHITLVTELAPDLGLVRADPSQIDQVLVNLVVNARDSMRHGGDLTIETANVCIAGEQPAELVDLPPGAYVRLSVQDSGCGMDTETQARIFEPFFTTKETSKGTGLGLSTAYGIVKQSGGVITVWSAPGQGSSFNVYLPRLTEAVVPSSLQIDEVKTAVRATGGETILLVEDEEAVRRFARLTLEQCGYVVLEASTCAEAVLRSHRHDGPIHLLLTDVVMPDGSGRSVAQRLAGSRQDTKVLYMSGHTGNTVVDHGILNSGTSFLQKPFTAASLERRVREVMES